MLVGLLALSTIAAENMPTNLPHVQSSEVRITDIRDSCTSQYGGLPTPFVLLICMYYSYILLQNDVNLS